MNSRSFRSDGVGLAGSIGLLIVLSSCGGPAPGERSPDEELALQGAPEVQVRVFEGSRCRLILPGRVAVVATGTDEVLFHGTFDEPTLEVQAGNLRLGSWRGRGPVDVFVSPETDEPGLALEPGERLGLTIAGEERRFRGSLRLVARQEEVEVINVLSLEQYLVGVVGAEMPLSFPDAALRAQAIVARTFAMYELLWARDHGGVRPFDATTSFQVYRGVREGEEPALAAVLATAGEVLLHEGRIFRSYFHSTCGGRTLSARNVFGDASIAPLEGADCSACAATAHATWELTVEPALVAAALRAWARGHDVELDAVESLELERDEDGRVSVVLVSHGGGGFGMRGQRFRSLLRDAGHRLRSSSFDVERDASGAYVFRGQGFGHRVGLCQVGAGERALQDNYRRILAHYYPGSEVDVVEAFY